MVALVNTLISSPEPITPFHYVKPSDLQTDNTLTVTAKTPAKTPSHVLKTPSHAAKTPAKSPMKIASPLPPKTPAKTPMKTNPFEGYILIDFKNTA